jgi:hypothetical protein
VRDVEEKPAGPIWLHLAIHAVLQWRLPVIFVMLTTASDIKNEWVHFVEIVFMDLLEQRAFEKHTRCMQEPRKSSVWNRHWLGNEKRWRRSWCEDG